MLLFLTEGFTVIGRKNSRMTHHHQHTGYLLGKVRLEGAIRSEVLANLVETLIQKYHTPSSESSPNNKKQFKFNEHHK